MASDLDPAETREWLDSLDAVLAFDGPGRASFLLDELMAEARRNGAPVPYSANTPYLNTIPPQRERPYPGDQVIEHAIRSMIRWDAVAVVLRANKESSELGGHIASFQSAATLYDVGFNHFWHAPSEGHGGDLVYLQGHSAPGIYARAFVEGRLTEQQLQKFRQETGGGGLSSYPHPWLMPEFWQFPTVSMGLGPIMSIYQARFLKYLSNRGLADTGNRHVWAFLGDGEMDEPESLGAISLAGRERLDNLIFVINCNLQRLDGPVRGNGKIIQELEALFRGAGLERAQGDLGQRLGPAHRGGHHRNSAQADGRGRRRRVPGLQVQERCLRAAALLRPLPRATGHGSPHVRRRSVGAGPRRPRPGQGTCGLRRGRRAHRAAHGHPGQDGQGVRDGCRPARARTSPTSRRRWPRTRCGSSGTGSPSTLPTTRSPTLPFLRPAEDSPEMRYLRQRREALALPARRRRSPSRWRCRRCRRSTVSSRAAESARSPPRWGSCGC